MIITVVCEFCGKQFNRKSSKAKRNKFQFCSKACYNAHRRQETDKKMIGRRFGRYIVLSRNGYKWNCRCDCGTEKSVDGADLLNGSIVSCGCYRSRIGKRMIHENGLDTIMHTEPGTRYGRFVVLRRNGRKYGAPAYLCRCDCGNEVTVAGAALRAGRSKSCGCLHRDVSREQAKRLFTKHGLYKDPEYIRYLKHRRYHADRDWTHEMEELLLDMQPVCVVCGATENLEHDHVLPHIKGGRLEPGNVVRLCRSCNATKHDKSVDQLPAVTAAAITQAAQRFEAAWIT